MMCTLTPSVATIGCNTCLRVPHDLQRRLCGSPLRPEAAQRADGLRRQSDVAHYSNAGVDDRAHRRNARRAAACALQSPSSGM